MWLYVIDTSPETDYALVVLATVLTAGASMWAVIEAGWNPATAVLFALTLVLAGASVYARSLWQRARRDTERRRIRAANLRAFR